MLFNLLSRSPREYKHVQINDRLEVSNYRYPDERANKACVYSRTADKAAEYLYPRCHPEALNPYDTVAEILKGLAHQSLVYSVFKASPPG